MRSGVDQRGYMNLRISNVRPKDAPVATSFCGWKKKRGKEPGELYMGLFLQLLTWTGRSSSSRCTSKAYESPSTSAPPHQTASSCPRRCTRETAMHASKLQSQSKRKKRHAATLRSREGTEALASRGRAHTDHLHAPAYQRTKGDKALMLRAQKGPITSKGVHRGAGWCVERPPRALHGDRRDAWGWVEWMGHKGAGSRAAYAWL